MLQNSSLCHCEASPTAMPWQSPGREPLYLIRCPFPAIPTLARNDIVLRTSYKYFPKTKAPERVL